MAVSIALVAATDYRLLYQITSTGGGGSDTLENATMVTDAAGNVPMLQMLRTAVANTAEATALLQELQPGKMSLFPRGTAPGTWEDLEITPREDAGVADIFVEETGAGGVALLEIQRIHTYDQ